jgi:hypothetical protein
MKVGDLVRMKDYDKGLIGLVVCVHPSELHKSRQVGIQWCSIGGKIQWEPEGWLEVVSESR